MADPEKEAKQWFAANLRHFRLVAKLTQSELGDAVGVTHRYATRLESGTVNVTIGTVARLARVLGVSPDQLLLPRSPDPGRKVGRPEGSKNSLSSKRKK